MSQSRERRVSEGASARMPDFAQSGILSWLAEISLVDTFAIPVSTFQYVICAANIRVASTWLLRIAIPFDQRLAAQIGKKCSGREMNR
jgi:hypothetical protein